MRVISERKDDVKNSGETFLAKVDARESLIEIFDYEERRKIKLCNEFDEIILICRSKYKIDSNVLSIDQLADTVVIPSNRLLTRVDYILGSSAVIILFIGMIIAYIYEKISLYGLFFILLTSFILFYSQYKQLSKSFTLRNIHNHPNKETN
jgi:hypothetical protein